MEPLTVRALMSSPVISVTPHTRLPQIKHLLHEHGIRRLPVLDRARLVGLVALDDLRSALPSDASSLSIYELSYRLSSITAAEIMRAEVVTVAADATLVEALQRMLAYGVGGLPVLDGQRLVGMLTRSDIFRAAIAGQLALLPAHVVSASRSGRTARLPI